MSGDGEERELVRRFGSQLASIASLLWDISQVITSFPAIVVDSASSSSKEGALLGSVVYGDGSGRRDCGNQERGRGMNEGVQWGVKEGVGDTDLYAELNAIRDRLSFLAGGSHKIRNEVYVMFDEIVKQIYGARFTGYRREIQKQMFQLPPLGVDGEAALRRALPDIPVMTEEQLQIRNGFRPQLQEDISNDVQP